MTRAGWGCGLSTIVAIDGPAASGKSTVAREVAARLGFHYVDSGALYRGISWLAIEHGLAPDDRAGTENLVARAELEFVTDGGAVRFLLDGRDPGAALRSEPVRARVSAVASLSAVRAAVTAWLRTTARFGDIVMDGRDIGTVVFPGAAHKYYLDADPAERARRRHAELVARGESIAFDAVLREQQQRDARDSSRRDAPLRAAPDATIIDTTGMTVAQVADMIVRRVRP